MKQDGSAKSLSDANSEERREKKIDILLMIFFSSLIIFNPCVCVCMCVWSVDSRDSDLNNPSVVPDTAAACSL